MTNRRKLLWWLMVTFSLVFATISVTEMDSINYIMMTDKSFISFGIILLYFISTGFLGMLMWRDKEIKFDKFYFTSDLMLNLGLIGTLVGMAMTFSIFNNANSLTETNIAEISNYIAKGVGTAITTTLVGLICSVFLKLQLEILSDE